MQNISNQIKRVAKKLFLFVFIILSFSVFFRLSGGMTIEHSKNADIVTTSSDSAIFAQILNKFGYKDLSINEYITEIGKFFIGTPYTSSTLDIDDNERLVINLSEMDCVTFVEYVTAFALCFSNKEYDFDSFIQKLTLIRYKSGIIDGYSSRLHYFSDWLFDNTQKGIITIVSELIGNAQFDCYVNFMTTNPSFYKQLTNTSQISLMKTIEASISSYSMKYITKNYFKTAESEILDGDIIALTTSIKGLDVSHVGLAVIIKGRVHLLHASSTSKKVEITTIPFDDYLQKRTNVTGVLVGRLKK
ncbi:MAG: DUF1460 domain-containing protein [Marinilabiliaceae bacterium]|nr:DUF1460 domain-containing protein [Marinilabiliaceae bacterium]